MFPQQSVNCDRSWIPGSLQTGAVYCTLATHCRLYRVLTSSRWWCVRIDRISWTVVHRHAHFIIAITGGIMHFILNPFSLTLDGISLFPSSVVRVRLLARTLLFTIMRGACLYAPPKFDLLLLLLLQLLLDPLRRVVFMVGPDDSSAAFLCYFFLGYFRAGLLCPLLLRRHVTDDVSNCARLIHNRAAVESFAAYRVPYRIVGTPLLVKGSIAFS